jgi:ABC-type molybdate transport system substrate-binding protein
LTPPSVQAALLPLAAASLLLAAVAAGLDLHRVETRTIVVYTTPALKDFLEKSALPAFTRQTGVQAVPVYLSAGEEYSRVRMSRDRPEADLFLHASPLYLEKGYQDGIVEPIPDPAGATLGLGNESRAVPGGRIWEAFAWSPLVEVFRPGHGPVDLGNDTGRVGFAHPQLSNNGIYAVLFYESLDPAAGQSALSRTVVQPVNSAATIGGVADGSYDVTLGYEAVATLYKSKGAKIDDAVPLLHGSNATTPVLFSVGLVRNHPHVAANALVAFLFAPGTQDMLAKYGMRPMVSGAKQPKGLDVAHANVLRYDWSHWAALEEALPRYEVQR